MGFVATTKQNMAEGFCSAVGINHDSVEKKTTQMKLAQVFYVDLWVGVNIRGIKGIILKHQRVGFPVQVAPPLLLWPPCSV